MKDNLSDKIFGQNNVVFREIFKTHSAVMLLLDPEKGKIIEANNSASLFYGYSIEELRSMSIDQINTMPPEEINNERILAKERKRNYFLFQHKLKNDEIRSVAVHSTPVNIGEKTILFSIINDISERELVSEKLRESEEHFRALIEHSNDVISILDDKGNILYESPAHERVLGYRKGELIEKNVFEFVHPEDRERIKTQFAGLLKNPGETVSVNFRFKHKKSEFRFLEGAGTNLLNADAVRGVVVNYRDVSDRKRSEQELIEQEKLLRTIAENFPNSYVSILDNNLKVVFSSGMEFKNQNLDPEMFSGLSLDQIFGEHSGSVREHYRKTFRGEQQIFELHINGQDQLYKTVPLFSENGKIEKMLVVVENITDRKNAEAVLKKNEEQYKGLLEVAPVGIAILYEGKISYVNPKAIKILQAESQDNIIGKTLEHLIHPDQLDIALDRIQRMMDGEEIVGAVEYKAMRVDGSYVDVEVFSTLQTFDGSPAVQIVVNDISERKQKNSEIIRIAKEWEETFNAINDSVSIIAPDGKIDQYNTATLSMFGLTAEEMEGKKCFELVHGLKEHYPDCPIIRAKESSTTESMIFFENGRWLKVTVNPVFHEDNKIDTFVHVVEDITEIKNSENEMIKLKNGLEQQVKDQTKVLQEKVSDLQRFVDATVERELRMKDLYEENEKLKSELKKNEKTP